MASDIKTTAEDAEMAECDGEKVVTMMDVLQEQEDFEEDANAVLGASDEKNCTYSKGYIKRQAIYACMTCCPEAKSDPTKRAGVCLACSLMCHENHELVELYTKRNFRCDCGNLKFNSHPCTFTQDKPDLNEDNYYNQNFSGLYCTCQRPYPDPEATEEDEMIQCIICEDWLHASHLESTVPANGQYSEMICKTCMEKNEFLHDYSDLVINVENVDVDVGNNSNIDANNSKLCNGDAKTDVNDSDLNESVTEPVAEAADNNVGTESKDTLPETKEGTEIDSKESVETTDNSMETEQSDRTQQSNAESNVTADKTESQCTENNDEVKTESEAKTDTVSDDKKDEENVPEQADDEQSNEVGNKNEDSANEPEKPETVTDKKANEQNAEQMEEDRLLADDNPKTKSVENSDTTVNSAGTSKDNNEAETKSENECTPTVGEINNSSIKKSEATEEVTNETLPQNENDSNIDSSKSTTQNESSCENNLQSDNITEDVETPQKETTIEESSSSEKRKHVDEESDNNEPKKAKLGDKCVRPKGVKKIYKGATFWPSSFRQKLCTCQECISMYNDLSVLFLTDPEDTVTAYENLGKQKINGKPTTQYEKGLQALSSLDRIQQINALTEYNKMRDKLLDFLKSFKDRKEIVKEEDIKAFFAGMRPKREPDGVYFCR